MSTGLIRHHPRLPVVCGIDRCARTRYPDPLDSGHFPVLPFNNSPGSEQGHRTPIWDVWIQVLVEGAQKAFGIRRRWGWGQIESGGGGGGGGGGGVAGAAGAAAATAVAGDGGEDVDDGLMLDMMWVVGGVGENVDVIVVGSGGTVVVLMAVGFVSDGGSDDDGGAEKAC